MTRNVISNKVLLYVLSRYLTFAIQFVTTIYLAIKLGPYEFGVWSFILLITNYISYINLGIPNSLSIMLVQMFDNKKEFRNLIVNSFFLIACLSSIIITLCLCYYIFGAQVFVKYNIEDYLYLIALVGVLFHFNSLYGAIFRVNNRVFELGFFQIIVPLLILLTALFIKSTDLLLYLLFSTLCGHVLALIIFNLRRPFEFNGSIILEKCKKILQKGIYLFVYNTSFLFIIISTKAIISYFFRVGEFGQFNFSYTLSNAILLLLQAFTVLVFPKIIYRLSSNDLNKVLNLKNQINASYVTLSYAMIFLAIPIIPLLSPLFPEYSEFNSLTSIISMTILLSTNVFSNTSILMAKHKEKKLAAISLTAFLINLTFSFVFVLILDFSIKYMILATLLSYLTFGACTSKVSLEACNCEASFKKVFFDFMPLRLLIPYVVLLTLILFELELFTIFGIIVFVLFNIKELRIVRAQIINVILNEKIADIEKT